MLLINSQSSYAKVPFGIKVKPELKQKLAEFSNEWMVDEPKAKDSLLHILLNTDDTLTLSLDTKKSGTLPDCIAITSNKYPGKRTSLADITGYRKTLDRILKELTPESLIALAEQKLSKLKKL